jgi:transposase
MTLYCGIDLHSTNSVLSVLNEHDEVIFERRLPNDLQYIWEALEPYRADLAGCAVESTYNWYWLVDGLQEAGFPMLLAHPGAIRQYDGIKHGNDRTDAQHLARLLRLGILPCGHIMPREERALRDLLRRRLLLVHQRTVLKLSLQGLITRYTARRLSANQVSQLERERIREHLGASDHAAFTGEVTWATMRSVDFAVELLEKEALKHCVQRSGYRILTTLPGVGKVLGMTILLETGGIERFTDAGHYASYARCVKSERISNGKRKGEGNRKNGNRYLAWAFIEAAHFGIIWTPKIKTYYQRKLAKSHLMVARKAVANKLARACYHMLKNQTPFDIERAFG